MNTTPLKPLLMLEGDWHGEGQGPYGPYDFETRVESRERWLLLTSTVFEPKTDKVTYVSTQVYGYGDDGLVLHLFDTAGAFAFREVPTEHGVRFEWQGDEDWKRSEFWPEAGGRIHFRYHAWEPTLPGAAAEFEGVWLPGKRPTRKP